MLKYYTKLLLILINTYKHHKFKNSNSFQIFIYYKSIHDIDNVRYNIGNINFLLNLLT